MKILIFTEGTVIMHSLAKNVSREERVQQSMNGVAGINDFENYIPNGAAVEKLLTWKSQGAEIYYLTSRKEPTEVQAVDSVLMKNGFPDAQNLLYRENDEEYKDVAERLLPDCLIEDDCESIGGQKEMTYPHISPELKGKICSIVVPEFAGIENLPDSLVTLVTPKYTE